MSKISAFEIDEWTLRLERVCPLCLKVHSILVDKNEYYQGLELYGAGTLVQHSFPNFNESEREFIMTGVCDDCWNKIEEEFED